jgi:hypothetical protein
MTKREIVKTTVAAGIAAGKAAGLGAAGTAALAVVAPSLAVDLLGLAVDMKRKSDQRKLDGWLAQVATLLHHKGVADAEALIQDNVDQPWAHDAVIDAARAILQDVDEAAVPVLARVTALQLQEQRVDRRTRRLVSMLGECDSELLDDLREVVEGCADSWRDGASSVELVVEPAVGGFRPTRIAGAGRVFFQGDGWLPVLGTLRRHGFLLDALPSLADREPGDVVYMLTADDFEYLQARLVNNP